MNRKGSMQLGVEAIIILVIAIVLLGSILYFIRGFMSDTSGQLGGIIEGLDESCGAQAGTPILPASYELKAGKINDVGMCVYNDAGRTIPSAKIFILECLKPDGSTESNFNGSTSDPILVASVGVPEFERDAEVLYKPKVNAQGVAETDLGVWTCNVQISQFHPKDLGVDTAALAGMPKIGPRQLTFDLS